MISKKLLEYGLLRQMDIQNSMYPDDIPVISSSIEPLELSKFVADNFPILIKNSNIFNHLNLNDKVLRSKIGELKLQVSETPYGNADSPIHGLLFVRPHITEMSGNQLLDLLGQKNDSAYYMQSQDGNLSKEFGPLLEDIPQSLEFANCVFKNPPEAVNLWIGNSGTTSRLHNDNYDNLFVQLTGKKVIYLIPPGDAYCLDEKFLTPATYIKNGSEFELQIDGTDINIPADSNKESISEIIETTQPSYPKVMFPTVDPSDSTTFNNVFTSHCKVYKVEVQAGDILYIPALWYHQVEINNSDLSVSVNYWYPASLVSPLWSKWDYIRLTSCLLRGYHDDNFFDIDEEE